MESRPAMRTKISRTSDESCAVAGSSTIGARVPSKSRKRATRWAACIFSSTSGRTCARGFNRYANTISNGRAKARTFRRVLTSKVVFRRTIWIVLDSVGIGAMPDAAAFGDPPHADTLGNIARLRGLALPNLAALGLGNIKPLAGIPPAEAPEGAFGRCALASPGKDTTTGHRSEEHTSELQSPI